MAGGHHAPKASSNSGGSGLLPNGIVLPTLVTGIVLAVLAILAG